ncbi:Zinc finger MYND domain-containing protein 10 [Holothuria leucospilota]|uniref:Zinc finger MYND domain-containing protein 10 n=1 Tax=Holothuria leucospilota TaxID=206669 RepID=A0A9Q1B9L4_HOLLE|nr:Zinc finger MYND domain-containing protein 10 [Holothuria leucospilota]
MDVKPGLCWRCETRLQSKKELCFLCKIAVYCSTKCLERDEARHGSVECKMWSRINKCEACGRIGRMKECSGCYAAWFCDKTCQGFAWKSHKVECSKWTEKAREVALAKKICV